MPPRRTRASAAAKASEPTTERPSQQPSPTPPPPPQPASPTASAPAPKQNKSKARAARHQPLLPDQPAAQSSLTASSDRATDDPSEVTKDGSAAPSTDPSTNPSDTASSQAKPPTVSPSSPPLPAAETTPTPEAKMSMSERMAKLSTLRKKMADSSKANRKDILHEQSRSRTLAAARGKGLAHARKMAEAEKLLEERDLKESGEDVERHRNFAYSIEDNDRWEAKLEEKERRRDKGVIDYQDAAERAYQRQIRSLKPDISSYQAQRAALESSSNGAPSSSSSSALVATNTSGGQVVRREDLYRDASTIYYGDHKPSDEAIDRVVGHLNIEQEQLKRRSRRRAEDPDEEVSYINKQNQHFNKKLKRYYDEYTKEIRENFERGTAL